MGVIKGPVSGTRLERWTIEGDSPVRENGVLSRKVPE